MDLPWRRGAKYSGCKTYAHYNRLKHSKELDVEFKRIATIYPFLTTNQLLGKAKKSVESQKQSAKKKNVAKQPRKVYDYDSNEDFKQGKRQAKRAVVANFKWESDDSSVDLDGDFSQRKHSGFMDLDADDASKRRNKRYVPLTVEKTERKSKKVSADKYKAALTNKRDDCKKRNEKISYIKKKPVVIEVIELSSDSEFDWARSKQPERPPENEWKTVKIKTEKLEIPLEESSPSGNEVLQSNYNKKRRVIESSSEGSTHSWTSHKVINKGPNKSADKAAALIAGVSDVQSRSVPETQVRQDATHSVSNAGFLCDLFD